MKCDICGEASVAHFTGRDADGISISRHLCEQHAREIGLPVPDPNAAAQSMVPKLRSIMNFMRTNDRMPSASDLRDLGGFGALSNAIRGTEEFDRQLKYLEDLADFIEQNQRLPSEEELPDPF